MKTDQHVKAQMNTFSGALEQRNVRALLDLYDDNAQLSLASVAAPNDPAQVVRGKSAIGTWVRQWCGGHESVRVVNQIEDSSEVTIIAECRQEDGTRSVLACTASLVEGLVARQFVVFI